MDTVNCIQPPSYEPPPLYSSPLDALPNYSCTVENIGHLLLKREFDAPKVVASYRQWQLVNVNLGGTRLEISNDCMTVSLSAQGGDVGIAADYKRRSFVLRLRLEGRQFLLATRSTLAMLFWLDRVNEAIAISQPLESRKEPRVPARPRAHSYFCTPSVKADICRGWREKAKKNRADRLWLERDENTDLIDEEADRFHSLCSLSSSHESEPDVAKDKEDEASRERQVSTHLPNNARDRIKKMILDQMRTNYAQRCARELLYDSPWKSKWYVREGKQISLLEIGHDPVDSSDWLRTEHSGKRQ